jgi:hypothetical protein
MCCPEILVVVTIEGDSYSGESRICQVDQSMVLSTAAVTSESIGIEITSPGETSSQFILVT